MTELMHQQHRLPVKYRIRYKLLVTTHSAYNHKTPTLLAKLIKDSKQRVQIAIKQNRIM